MIERAFRPGSDGDPGRSSPRFFTSGSTFEPAHRQIVRVRIRPSGKWETAAYNRLERSFYLWMGSGWLDIGSDPVELWTQAPPRSRD